jgi:hypothetical protein
LSKGFDLHSSGNSPTDSRLDIFSEDSAKCSSKSGGNFISTRWIYDPHFASINDRALITTVNFTRISPEKWVWHEAWL